MNMNAKEQLGAGSQRSRLKLNDVNTPVIGLGVLLASFAFSLLVGSFFLQPQGSKAITGLGLVSASTMTLNTSAATVNLSVTPTASGALASGTHTLTAATNVPTGYNLAISTPTTPALTTIGGTLASPTALTDNTWGYATTRNTTSTTANTVTNNFDTSYAVPTPSGTSVWANPSTTATIKNTQQSSASDATTVYYGARVNLGLSAGTYNSTVRYTATANLTTIPAPTIVSITPLTGTTAGGTAISIVGTGFAVNDQSVTTGVTVDGTACASVTISSNTPTTGQDTIYCNTPVHPTAAAVNVAVTTWRSTATATNGFTYVAPTPTITAPTASQIFAAGTTSTNLTVTTNFAATCYYGTAASPTTVMTTTGGTSHSVSITGLTNGSTNTRYVRCNAASGHSYSSDVSVTFYVKTATPTVSITAPTAGQQFAAGTTSTTLTVNTNVTATCYYGTAASPTTQMATTNVSTGHTQSITGLTNGSTNTRYVRCTAGSGSTISDYSSDQSVVFYVRTATPAAPTLSPANGATVSTGTTTITVTSSGATCTWGTSSGSYPNASGATRTTTTGTNTLYYSCVAGSGNTQSAALTGSWSYTGQAPVAQTGDPIQNITKATCPSTITNVYDTRDNRYYSIQKLADGNCWMLTNLAYGGTEAGTQFTSGAGQSTTGNGAASGTIWDRTNPPASNQKQWVDPTTAAVTQYNGTRCATAYRTTAASINYTECGFLYNWCAALGNSNSACGQTSGDVANAGVGLCPAGWRLPTGGPSGEFQAMYTAIGGTHANLVGASSTWRGVYSGYFSPGYGLNAQSTYGYYWSATALSAPLGYYLFFSTSTVGPASNTGKYVGFAVRCVTTS